MLLVGAGVAQQMHNIKRVSQGRKPIETSASQFFDAVDSNGFSNDQYWIRNGINDFHSGSYH